MSYFLNFECGNLTESERDILLAKLDIVCFHIFKGLKVQYNRDSVWVNQEISSLEVAFNCFKVLSNLNGFSDNPHVICSLSSKDIVGLEDGVECQV